MIGIYKLVFEDGSFYIGQSTNIEQRLAAHKCTKGKGIPKLEIAHKLSKLKSLDIVEECSIEELNDREIFWIGILKPPLNTLPGGKVLSGINHPRCKYSEEQVKEVVKLYTETDISIADIEILTEVGSATVHDICKGRSHTWATVHLELESIRATKEANKSITVYSPDNTKYIVDYGDYTKFCSIHQGISTTQLTAFKTKEQNRTRSGWTTYYKNDLTKTLVSDEDIEFQGTEAELKEIMKDFGLAKYSIARILDGHSSKGWHIKKL